MKIINNISKLYSRRKELRNNSTPQEIILWVYLKKSQLGFKFRRQHSIGGYIVDFYCPLKKLVIEIDGSQHYQKNAVKYDAIRSNFLKGLNLRILRFSNGDINANMEGVLMKIKSKL
jgi:very-short-patch-repair endonuclease